MVPPPGRPLAAQSPGGNLLPPLEGFRVPVLPLIDLLILIAWTSLIWAFVHKALWLAFALSFTVLGLTPYDFVLGSGICLLFALTLAARVWVRAHEPKLIHTLHRSGHQAQPVETLPDFPDPRQPAASPAAVRRS